MQYLQNLQAFLTIGLIEDAARVLDWVGLVAFAATGALAASRKQMDIAGFALLATVTGIGGDTLRDTVLGLTPVFWIRQPAYLLVCVGVACLLFFTAHISHSRVKLLLWFDAIGLALVCVTGTSIALSAGAGYAAAIAMGVISATFGGIIRDMIAGETPVILSHEIYVTAALLGASVYAGCMAFGVQRPLALPAGFCAAFILRAAAMSRGWSLPRYKPRPGR